MKSITVLILCFTTGAMLAHHVMQGYVNAIDAAEAQIWQYTEQAIVGYVRMDEMGQLYYEGK